jgi:prophage regulatory protein
VLSSFETELDRIIRLPELIRITGLSRASIYRLIEKGNFPAPIELSVNAKGWFASQIRAWMESLRTVAPPNPEADPPARPQRSTGRSRAKP